ncbi:MAG: hypothetical protein M1819_001662 [Sarea resinae]|nr:MAG: hypothetical protein M1819_001662 [Sarea resinae]
MSVHDPQHMPPRCCTQDHIPLKHVERLFNDKFKILWNKKYQEYTTKNRIYCPNKGCGEWIKPANIHVEAGGRKCGKCSRCKTKVCCSCNGKWHRSRECPNDEETKRIVEIAKTEGWQRCYNCRAMVELKEGCNHMTCRCTAQFCMICGSKWKSCDCPWFNYNNDVEPNPGDRLNHMNIPRAVNILFRREPPAYQDELDHRRRQELEDEAYARRLQVLGLDGDDDDRRTELLDASYDDTWGVGNTMDHHMNADYVPEGRRALPLPPPAAPDELAHPPLPPPLRRHTSHSRRYNSSPSTRPADRVIPARTSMDYAAEAALHRPFEAVERRRGRRRASLLAGLNSSVPGSGGGRNRVGAWLRYVEFGPPPDERIVGAGLVENGELVREVGVA